MIEVTIRITAPDEETLRRTMDDIAETALRLDREANDHDAAAKRCPHERVAKKYELLAKRRRDIAKTLDVIADAIDHAEPRKVL